MKTLYLFALLAKLAVSLPQFPQIDTKKWQFDTKNVTINIVSFTEIRDGLDRFYIKRLAPSKADWVHDCYEVRNNTAGDADFKFCYPSLHVAGVAKCGTSSMFGMLTHHTESITDQQLDKEYCATDGNLYQYWKGMAPSFEAMFSQQRIYVSGCIQTETVVKMHSILRPKALYIVLVRDLAGRMWSAYNYWCDPKEDLRCRGGDWTTPGMYRSPGMFDEMLKSSNYPLHLSHDSVYNCATQNYFYTLQLVWLEKYVPAGQLVLISLEGLSHVPHVLVGVICHCHRIYRRF
jgi:hypothetical protein